MNEILTLSEFSKKLKKWQKKNNIKLRTIEVPFALNSIMLNKKTK